MASSSSKSEAEPLLSDSDDEEDPSANLSVLNASVLLANCCIGSGVLSFPYAFSQVGIVLGAVLFAGFASLLSFTLQIIVRSLAVAQRTDPTVCSYEALVQIAGGDFLALFAEITMTLYLFGASVAYQIIMADTALPICVMLFGPDSWVSNSTMLTVLPAVLLLLPLTLMRHLHGLSKLSTIAVCAVLYMVAVVVAECMSTLPVTHEVELVVVSSRIFTVFPVFCFALGCHLNAAIVFSQASLSMGRESANAATLSESLPIQRHPATRRVWPYL